MGVKSKIEWTDNTWNPVSGCTKVSDGCRHCYAERMAKRLAGRCGYPAHDPFSVTLHPDKLYAPLHWRKPRRVFVNSMSDLFHDDVPDYFLDEVFGTILACKVFKNEPDHIFQILTKRPERMRRYFTSSSPSDLLQRWAQTMKWVAMVEDPDVLFSELVFSETCHDWDSNGRNSSGSEYKPWGYTNKLFPLPNVWFGVSVENQTTADERIPLLLQTPAAVRFISAEPLLEPVSLRWLAAWDGKASNPQSSMTNEYDGLRKLDWVIAGAETGHNARPMHPDWVRGLRDQCQEAGVPFFFKHWGKKEAGRLLDGRTWDDMPPISAK
ncbi:phage protein Gp37/Gp68 [Peptococcaceae bacterium CEB3]|nr:phage protein Gp37/Gp68 [Peptococcaceae bacterium CEB3]